MKISEQEGLSPAEIAKLDVPPESKIELYSHLIGRHDPMRTVVRRVVKDIIAVAQRNRTKGNLEIPEAYQAWLDSGDEKLRAAARNVAARAKKEETWFEISDAAYIAARDEAYVAVWAAAHASAAAREKYIGWLAEFLENIE